MQNQIANPDSYKQGNFPFKLDDLHAWTIKRTDGTVTKFVLTKSAQSKETGGNSYSSYPSSYSGNSVYNHKSTTSLGSYCSHVPSNMPLVDFPPDVRPEGRLGLWIGGMSGARQTKDTFNFVIDGGDVINLWGNQGSILSGDDALAATLGPYVSKARNTRVLKIDWEDRQAPPVSPEFWVELNKQLHGDVMTCCMGGHGRSGTAFVCLLMVNAKDYDAKDAIVHLRAVHCPRAIESVVQWEYIDSVAKYLGRTPNAKEAMPITDYDASFQASKKPTAVATRDMITAFLEDLKKKKEAAEKDKGK